MNKNKVFITMLSLVIACTMTFTGCQTSGSKSTKTTAVATPAVTAAGTFPIVKTPITLKVYLERGAMTDADVAKLSSNGVLKALKAKTNINLKFTFLSPEDGKNKMILAFASGDYPDAAFLGFNTALTQADVMQYGIQEKILTPLNSLIDKYGVETKNIFALRPNDKSAITAPDGNIYGLPRFTECGHAEAYPKLWFNTSWLAKVGMKAPQTTTQLEAVLKAFKTQDPNGDGKADEVALTGSNDWSDSVEYWIMNSFIDCPAASSATDPRPFLSMINNKVTFVGDTPQYKQGIIFLKKLYDEGLLSPSDFTQNSTGLAQQVQSNPNPKLANVGAFTADHLAMGVDFNNKDMVKQYTALAPVAGPDGVRYQPYSNPAMTLNTFNFVIFDSCKNKAAAFRLADYMLSEAYIPYEDYGIEGINWEKPKDPNTKNIQGGPLKYVPIILPANATQAEKDKQANNTFSFNFQADLSERRAAWIPVATPYNILNNYECYLEAATIPLRKYFPAVTLPRSLFMDKNSSDQYDQLKTNITTDVIKNTSMFITGARPLSEWDSYVSELKKYGSDKYVALYTTAYEKYLKNLKK